MAVWFMRSLRRPPREGFILFCAEIATGAGRVTTPTDDRRDNLLRMREPAHALNYGSTR